MKSVNFGGATIKYSNPVFREVTLAGDVKRNVTLCHVALSLPNDSGFINSIGISILNPADKKTDKGKLIAEGRAVKNPVSELSLVSHRKLPKPIVEEQLMWAEKHVERNILNFISEIREALK